MGYWRTVAGRAAKEAAKDVRLDTVVGVVILLASQAVIGFGGFLLLVAWTDTNIWTRVFTCLAPFLLYPVVFLIRMVTVPRTIWREDQSALAANAASLDASAKKAEGAKRIAALHTDGHQIFERVVTSDAELEGWKADVQAWRESLFEAVAEAVGDATAQTLDTITSVSAGYYAGRFNDEHNTRKLYLAERLGRVRELAARLEAHA